MSHVVSAPSEAAGHVPVDRVEAQRRFPSLGLDGLPPLLSVERAGSILGMSRRTAYRHAADGHIPTVRFGRRIQVPTAKLLELLGLASTARLSLPPADDD